MAHPKLNTVNVRLSKPHREFLNVLGGGTARIGKQVFGLDILLDRYFRMVEDYPCEFDECDQEFIAMKRGRAYERFQSLPEFDQVRTMATMDRALWQEVVDGQEEGK